MATDRVEQLESDIENLRKDFAEINESLKGLAETKAHKLKSNAKEMYHQAADKAQDLWEDVSERGEEYYYKAREQFDDGLSSINDCVREKPLQSLAIVAGIGFLLGFLTRR